MSQCSECRTDRDIETAAAIAELRTEVRGLRSDIRETVITQLKDHGKRVGSLELTSVKRAEFEKLEERVAAIEGRAKFQAGWMACAGTVGGLLGAGAIKLVPLLFK